MISLKEMVPKVFTGWFNKDQKKIYNWSLNLNHRELRFTKIIWKRKCSIPKRTKKMKVICWTKSKRKKKVNLYLKYLKENHILKEKSIKDKRSKNRKSSSQSKVLGHKLLSNQWCSNLYPLYVPRIITVPKTALE